MVKLIYGIDQDGEEILMDTRGEHQVMMRWEKEYMEFCVDRLKPHGRVLEVGFGLGYSANRIQTYPAVTEHVIIECAPAVWDHMETFLKTHDNTRLVKGRWQDVLYTCGQFDCIFFDDYDTENTRRRGDLFRRELVDFNCLKPGSRIMYYGTSPVQPVTDDLALISEAYTTNIPERCNYAQGNTMYAITETVQRMPIKLPAIAQIPNSAVVKRNHTIKNAKVALSDAIHNMHCMYRDGNMEGLDINTQCILEGGYSLGADQRHEVQFYRAFSLFKSDPKESKSILDKLASEMDSTHELYPFVKDNLERITSNQQLQE